MLIFGNNNMKIYVNVIAVAIKVTATLRKKRKLAAVSGEIPENTRNSQSHNTLDPEMVQEFISQVSEDIEGRVTEKLSKEFSRTESRILGAQSKPDKFLLSPQARNCSAPVPGTSWNSNSENRDSTGVRSLDDTCPEVSFSYNHSVNLNSSEVEEYPHIVTGAPDETRNRPHTGTGIQEEIPYCSPGTSSGKQKEENLGEILAEFRRKYVKPQSIATAKHEFQRLVFNPANQKLIDFLDHFQKLAKDAFGVTAQEIIENFIYAKMPPLEEIN